jgi:hypothetical protein
MTCDFIELFFLYFEPLELAEYMMSLTCIREAPDPNLGPDNF